MDIFMATSEHSETWSYRHALPDGYTQGIPPAPGVYHPCSTGERGKAWHDAGPVLWTIRDGIGWWTDSVSLAPAPSFDENTSGAIMATTTNWCWRRIMPPSRIRIAHPWGAGPWHPSANRATIESWVVAMNAQYGPGTHRIEVEP